jgi:hypothetical protein
MLRGSCKGKSCNNLPTRRMPFSPGKLRTMGSEGVGSLNVWPGPLMCGGSERGGDRPKENRQRAVS